MIDGVNPKNHRGLTLLMNKPHIPEIGDQRGPAVERWITGGPIDEEGFA
jgi:hypothetical protein